MASTLRIYLQNHEAAARAGIDLCRRAAGNQHDWAHGQLLEDLCMELQDDHGRLRMIMREVGVRPNPLLGLLLQAGERVGRLKPNGRVVSRSPLSDLIEVEALLQVVAAKRTSWHALAAAPMTDSVLDRLPDLIARADGQLARLRSVHETVAAQVLR